jgi:putative salt-induced outer membrane protein
MTRSILVAALLTSSFALADEVQSVDAQQIQKQIAQAQATKEAAEAKIKELQALLPKPKPALKVTKNEFVTHTELGYISTGGNTKTQTFNLDSKIKKNWDRHYLGLLLDAQYATDNDVESKNKFFTELSYDYALTPRFAFNYLAGYKRDKFSAYDYQFYTGPGAKYKAIKNEKHNLSLEGSVLYSLDQRMDETYTSAGVKVNYPKTSGIDPTKTKTYGSHEYASLRAKAIYTWQMLENLKFDQEASYRVDAENVQNYFIYSKTGFSSKISDMFSAGISYKVDYVNHAGDKKRTDTTFTVGIIIDY